MKQTSIWNYIWIGTCLRYLQDQREGSKVNGYGFLLENISEFIRHLDLLELYITKRASDELVKFNNYLKQQNVDYLLTSQDCKKMTTIATDIRKTFEAETKGVFVFIVEDKRLDKSKLLESIDKLFGPGIFDSLPDISKYDFAEAGKCIAFNRATAAAFHILRGTEKVVYIYYKKFIRPCQEGLTWGQMTHALWQKTKGKLPESLILKNLDHIREAFRNPTQHPDKIYEIHEVQDLFSLCVDAINRTLK